MTLRIALAQINATVGDLVGNKTKVVEFCARAKAAGADIVAFPELCVTGYPPEDLLLKEHFITSNLKTLKEIASGVRGIVAVVGFVDRGKTGELYNAAAVIHSGKVRLVYHKQALPNYSVFDERRYFTPGDRDGIFVLNGVPVGVSICEDIWVNDGAVARQAKAGVKALINISSSPYEAGKRAERLKLVSSWAQKAGAYVCYVNLVGGQDEIVFDGASMVVSPSRKLLTAGMQFSEDLVMADMNAAPSKKTFRKAVVLKSLGVSEKPKFLPALPEPLLPIDEVYDALVLGTHDYITKNGFQKVLIGLSGGIDSSLVAAIACDAVGASNVVGISMPTKFNAEGTKNDARQLAQNLGIQFHEIPIQLVLEANLKLLEPFFQGLPFGLAEENLQSRIRGNILMAFSNKFGWLVLTTGNKSEMATGYCTLYGDMSGGYAVIKDILKMKVYALSQLVNDRAGCEVIPRSVFDRAPSAELRENQTDQDSLPPYPELDALLVAYVEEHHSFKEMLKKGAQEPALRKVISLVDRSEYKRRQAPPGVKISKRAFGKDWRLPLTNHYKAF
ncbi:MAG: NAD+ synthase [Candidatus Omnitrophica bacterium]|nr:NAD+ synthase [Candidatus Omnitrophota bacterium]